MPTIASTAKKKAPQLLAGLWIWFQQRQIFHFADEICDTLDALISGRQPEGRDILIKDCIKKSNLLICDAMVSRNSPRFSSVS